MLAILLIFVWRLWENLYRYFLAIEDLVPVELSLFVVDLSELIFPCLFSQSHSLKIKSAKTKLRELGGDSFNDLLLDNSCLDCRFNWDLH